MTSRERILAAISHKPVDRVPIDLGGSESSGLTGIAWHKLSQHLAGGKEAGSNAPPEIVEPYQQVARVTDAMRRRFGIDTIGLFIEPAAWRDDTFSDGSPCRVPAGWQPRVLSNGDRVIFDADSQPVARMPAGGLYFDPVATPLAECISPADIARGRDVVATCDLPIYWDETPQATAARARLLHGQTDSAIVFNFCCHLLHAGTGLRGYEQFMMDLVLNRPLVEALLETLLEVYTERIECYAPLLRGHVDVVLFNDDLGTQSGPMISPKVYQALIQPRQAKLFGCAKKAFGAPLLFHSCGSVRAFIPGLIAAGVDALNPVQVSAEGMESGGLKRDFGKDICFWGGGCDSQQVLPRGTPADVRAEVRRRVADFASDGTGFVFTQVHNIQSDVPAENVVEMLDAAQENQICT